MCTNYLLLLRPCYKHLTYINSLNLHSNYTKQEPPRPHFTDKEAEAQRTQVTFQSYVASKWQSQDFRPES